MFLGRPFPNWAQLSHTTFSSFFSSDPGNHKFKLLLPGHRDCGGGPLSSSRSQNRTGSLCCPQKREFLCFASKCGEPRNLEIYMLGLLGSDKLILGSIFPLEEWVILMVPLVSPFWNRQKRRAVFCNLYFGWKGEKKETALCIFSENIFSLGKSWKFGFFFRPGEEDTSPLSLIW